MILNQVYRESLGVKVTAEERPEGGKGASVMILGEECSNSWRRDLKDEGEGKAGGWAAGREGL